jgi:uncharacterized protein (TIGR02679 family)
MSDSTSVIQLPDELRQYLADDSLSALWSTVRVRLERNGLAASGQVNVQLDDRGADRLAGLFGTPVRPGMVKVRLAALDTALRRSAAAAGLVTVTAAITESPLVDRRAVRAARAESWTQVWNGLDVLLADAGLAPAAWIPAFIASVRRSGLLTRAGVTAAMAAVEKAAAILGEIAVCGPMSGQTAVPAEAKWELAELASRCTGDAHGLDDGHLVAALVLRAAAVALDEPVPTSAAGRRELWVRLGVTPDLVSGTILVWGLRPHNGDRWAAMMRERADLRVITHLTLHELRGAAAATPLAAAGQPVHACENPQVLQAAARADCAQPLVCFAGNPASAGWLLLRGLIEAGALVRYHGDFDWPGMAIAGRLMAAGAQPWRLSAADYDEAAAALEPESRLTLSGAPVRTRWDDALAGRMLHAGIAVHEESLLPVLLTDLAK